MTEYVPKVAQVAPLRISHLSEKQRKLINLLVFDDTMLDRLMYEMEYWATHHWYSDCPTKMVDCDDCYSGDTEFQESSDTKELLKTLWNAIETYDYITDDSSAAEESPESK